MSFCESNGPVERAGDVVRLDVTDYTTRLQPVKKHHGKGTLASRESTGPASNDVSLRDLERSAELVRQFSLP